MGFKERDARIRLRQILSHLIKEDIGDLGLALGPIRLSASQVVALGQGLRGIVRENLGNHRIQIAGFSTTDDWNNVDKALSISKKQAKKALDDPFIVAGLQKVCKNNRVLHEDTWIQHLP